MKFLIFHLTNFGPSQHQYKQNLNPPEVEVQLFIYLHQQSVIDQNWSQLDQHLLQAWVVFFFSTSKVSKQLTQIYFFYI